MADVFKPLDDSEVFSNGYRPSGQDFENIRYDLRNLGSTLNANGQDITAVGLLNVNSMAWDEDHPILGTRHIWVDEDGNFRYKDSVPLFDLDGLVFGYSGPGVTTGWTPKGEHNPAALYSAGDLVLYEGASFVSRIDDNREVPSTDAIAVIDTSNCIPVGTRTIRYQVKISNITSNKDALVDLCSLKVNYSDNLLGNPSFESYDGSGYPNTWTNYPWGAIGPQALCVRYSDIPYTPPTEMTGYGDRVLRGGNPVLCDFGQCWQDIDVSGYATSIDASTAILQASAWIGGIGSSSCVAEVTLICYDADDVVLVTKTVGLESAATRSNVTTMVYHELLMQPEYAEQPWIQITNPGDAGPEGPQGPAGPQGVAGASGEGVPAGGSTGQVLVKASSTDRDTEWSSVVVGFTELTLTDSGDHINFTSSGAPALVFLNGLKLRSADWSYSNGTLTLDAEITPATDELEAIAFAVSNG